MSDYAYFSENYSDLVIGKILGIPFKRKYAKDVSDYVSFQISLAGNLIKYSEDNTDPVVYVCLSDYDFYFDGWHLSFPINDNCDQDFSVLSGVALSYADGTLVYGVKLLDLHNDDDLNRLCVGPIIKLAKVLLLDKKTVNEDVVEEILDKKRNELIAFQEREKLIS